METLYEKYEHNLKIIRRMLGIDSDIFLRRVSEDFEDILFYEKYYRLELSKCLDEYTRTPENAENLCKTGDYYCYLYDYAKGLEFYNKAIALGYAEAFSKLAFFYLSGIIVDKNEQTAFYLLKQAESIGEKKALYAIGLMYAEGKGVEQNYFEANKYFSKCLDNNIKVGYYGLGMYYERCLKDTKTAVKFYQKSLDEYPEAIEDIKRINPNYFESEALDAVSLYIIGEKCLNDGKYEKAIEYLNKSADLYYPKALLLLGSCYKVGKGVDIDYNKAFKFIKTAADQNDNDALCTLAYMYERGCGVQKDKKKALDLYQTAANLGSVYAKYMLNFEEQIKDDAIPVSLEKAFEIAKHAFDQKDYNKALDYTDLYPKDAKLQSLSGDCYYQLGSFVEAFDCYKKSALQNCEDGLLGLGYCYEKGYGIQQDMSKAEECYQKCIDCNSPQGFYYMGMMLLNASKPDVAYTYLIKAAQMGVKNAYTIGLCNYYETLHDTNTSEKYKDINYDDFFIKREIIRFKQCSEKQDPLSICSLGLYHYEGLVVERDMKKALELFEKSVELGYKTANYYMGICYENGIEVEKDKAKAIDFYRKAYEDDDSYAAEKALERLGISQIGSWQPDETDIKKLQTRIAVGDAKAMTDYGIILITGKFGKKKDIHKAIDLFQKSAKLGCINGIRCLAACYSDGIGIQCNKARAFGLYKRAADELNDPWCTYEVGVKYQNGSGVIKHLKKAKQYYKKAAEMGVEDAKICYMGIISYEKCTKYHGMKL